MDLAPPEDEALLAKRPRQVDEVREYSLGDELLLYVGDRDAAIALNESARAIWILSDGSRTVATIVDILAEEATLEPGAIRGDVLRTVREFLDLGIVA